MRATKRSELAQTLTWKTLGGTTMKWILRTAAIAGLACLLGGGVGVVSAQAAPVRFVYHGGAWSDHFHSGWHRYWGGPSIGFYYAPEPVYLVAGYDDPYYYTGPDFWYSNPSFGLNINLGGGGGGGWYDSGHHWHSNGGGHGFSGGHRYSGGHSYSGGHAVRSGHGVRGGHSGHSDHRR